MQRLSLDPRRQRRRPGVSAPFPCPTCPPDSWPGPPCFPIAGRAPKPAGPGWGLALGAAEAPERWVPQGAMEPQGTAQPQGPATHSQERQAPHHSHWARRARVRPAWALERRGMEALKEPEAWASRPPTRRPPCPSNRGPQSRLHRPRTPIPSRGRPGSLGCSAKHWCCPRSRPARSRRPPRPTRTARRPGQEARIAQR